MKLALTPEARHKKSVALELSRAKKAFYKKAAAARKKGLPLPVFVPPAVRPYIPPVDEVVDEPAAAAPVVAAEVIPVSADPAPVSPTPSVPATPPRSTMSFTEWLRTSDGLRASDPRYPTDRVRMQIDLDDRLKAAFLAGAASVG